MALVIREVDAGSDEQAYRPRGALKQLWQTRDFETMVSGPAETGKTFGALQYADALLWKYPGAQGIMSRSTYAALVPAAMQTYRKIIGLRPGDTRADSGIAAYGGEKPEWFQYPNGSRLWCVGLDNPGKALSSERDFIYVNQAEEIDLADWETMMTRCTGRGAVMPYTRIFGDCNPGPPSHWIINRPSLTVLESRHEDNPTLFDDAGIITEQGKRSMAVLDALTGVRYKRLRKGQWAQAEGAVYDEFDRAVHLKKRFEIPKSWRRIRSIDFGYTNPFVCQWWAIDPDGRMILYRELYMTRRIVKHHAAQILALSEGERIECTVADHDAEDRATLHDAGIMTRPAWKSISPGIQAVQQRLKKAGDGRPRLFIMDDSTLEADTVLLAKKEPVSTLQEIEVYVWPTGVDGKPMKEVPLDKWNHGMDAARYAVAYADNLGAPTSYKVKVAA